MPDFNIIEFDKDYRTITQQYTKNFRSKEEADKYCRDKSWTGYDYFAKEVK